MDTLHHSDDADGLEDRLPGLLTEAATEAPGNPQRLSQVHARASRRRRNRMAAAAGSLAVVALGAAVTPALLGEDHRESGASSPAALTTKPTSSTEPPEPTAGTQPRGHYAALFSVPNTTLSTALGIAYGTGPGTRQVTIPDGSRIGVVELACQGHGGIGVDDHGTLGADIPVPSRPTDSNCGTGLGAEADLVAEGTRTGPNGAVAPGTPVTLTVRTKGNVRWWLVVGRVGGQSRSGIPDPDQMMIGPVYGEKHLAGRTTAAGLLYECGERKERVRVSFTASGTPVDTTLTCAGPGQTYVLRFARPLHLTAPVKDVVIRRIGSQSPPADYVAGVLTPSGLAVWSQIPGVVRGTLTP
jgi:hypothetical protein